MTRISIKLYFNYIFGITDYDIIDKLHYKKSSKTVYSVRVYYGMTNSEKIRIPVSIPDSENEYDVTVVTQNVDNLHEAAGSTKVIHLHGELMKATSSNNPNDPDCIVDLPVENPDIHIGDKAKDGSQLRPFIVWFGEAVPQIEPAIMEVSQADIIVIVGTSLNVYPAAGLINYAPHDAKMYLIDPRPANVDPMLHVNVIKNVATVGMKELTDLLKEQA